MFTDATTQSLSSFLFAANATNSVKLRELMEEQEKVREQLEEKEERWMYLNELAEKFGL